MPTSDLRQGVVPRGEGCDDAFRGGRQIDALLVAEITPRRFEVVGVAGGELRRDEARHGRLARKGEDVPGELAEGAAEVAQAGRDPPRDRRNVEPSKELVGPVPQPHRLLLPEEVRPTGVGRLRAQGAQRVRVGRRGVVDVGQADLVIAGAQDREPTAPPALEQARNQMRVARADDEVRANGAGGERSLAVRAQHQALGHGLRLRIGCQIALGVGEVVRGLAMVLAVEADTGRARIDETLNRASHGRFQQVAGAVHVGRHEVPARAPHAGERGRVHDGFESLDRRAHRDLIGQVERDVCDAERFQLRVGPAARRGDRMALGQEPLDDGLAEEPTTACDEDFHDHLLAAEAVEGGCTGNAELEGGAGR